MRYLLAILLMFTSAAAFGQATYVTFSKGTSSSTDTPSHTVPVGWSEGNLAVAIVYCGNKTVSTVPSGWALAEKTGGFFGFAVYTKTLEAGDLGAAFSWTLSASQPSAYVAFVEVSGHNSSSPVDVDAVTNSSGATTTYTFPGVTTSVDNCLVIHTGRNYRTMSASSGDTGTIQSNSEFFLATQSKATAGAVAAGVYTSASAGEMDLYTLAIAPAAGGGPAINPISSSIPGSSLDPIRTTIP